MCIPYDNLLRLILIVSIMACKHAKFQLNMFNH